MNSFKKGFADGIPIGLGYLSVSFTFGIMATELGFPLWQAVMISALNLTSAGQVAGLSVMAGLGGPVEMILTQLVINLRYSLMSLSMTQKVDASMSTGKRFFFGAFHTDEIYAVAMGQKDKIGSRYFTGLIIAPYVGWTLGTFLGALSGQILPEMLSNALSVALYGMFIAICIPEMKKDYRMLIIVLLAVAIRCLFFWTPVLKEVSGGFAVIICALVASFTGALFFPIGEEGEKT